jgi:hypothetical protein
VFRERERERDHQGRGIVVDPDSRQDSVARRRGILLSGYGTTRVEPT